MEHLIQTIIELIKVNVDFIAVIIVLLGGIFAKHYLSNWKLDNKWKTLIVGTVFLTGYSVIKIYTGKMKVTDIDKIFFSYCLATSLYELLLKYMFDFLFKKTGIKVEE